MNRTHNYAFEMLVTFLRVIIKNLQRSERTGRLLGCLIILNFH